MTSWFWDVSNHQSVTPSLNGWDGLIVKASEGSGFRDGRFWQHINVAREAKKAHAGYHFLRSDSPIKDQAETFMSVCPVDIAAVPDVEWIKDQDGRIISAPTLAQTIEFVDRLRQRGYHVPMQYLPRWYWNHWGQPDLIDTGLPPLWGSYYPDYIARPRDVAWSMIPESAKRGFGGLPMVALQFTSSPLDQNRSEMTPEQLYSFLSTTQRAPGGGGGSQEADMSGVFLRRGADTGRCFIVEISTQVRAKWHIPNPEVLDVLSILMGLTATNVPDWTLDYIGNADGPPPIPVDVDEDALAAAVSEGVIPAVVKAMQDLPTEGLSVEETIDAVREALRRGTGD